MDTVKGSVEVSGPGEARRYPLRYFNGDEGTALNVARSTAITLASRAAMQRTEPGAFYVRDELDAVYCRVEWDAGRNVQVVMT